MKIPNKVFRGDELSRCLERLDGSLHSMGVPLRFRPLECFKSLYGPVDDCVRANLFDPIVSWYISKHGIGAFENPTLGRIPLIIRNVVYLAVIPLTSEDSVVRFVDFVEKLPRDIADSFTFEEFSRLGRKIGAATEAFQKLYELYIDDHILSDEDRPIIKRALFDFEHTATSLRDTGDTQNAIFHSHAAAEKFLKVALRRVYSNADLRRFGHNLPKLFDELVARQSRFEWLRPSLDALHNAAPDMEIRYSTMPRTPEQAVEAFNAAIAIAGTLAGIWLFDVARGAKTAKFVPGNFYRDFGRRKFYCRMLAEA